MKANTKMPRPRLRIIHRFFVCASLALGAGAAHADTRIAVRMYNPSVVTMIGGVPGIQTTIEFSPTEHIENVAVGNSADWQVTPNKRADLLFVKPVTSPSHTNMTVVTDQHTYLFDLVARPHVAAQYLVRFAYPASDKRLIPAANSAAATASAATAVALPATASVALPKHAWSSTGTKALFPSDVFDDGHSVWIAWAKDVSLPAILLRDKDGSEGPANFVVHDDFIVIDTIPEQIVLRRGKDLATLFPMPDQSNVPSDERDHSPAFAGLTK